MRFNLTKWLPKITKLATYLVAFWIIFLLSRTVWQNWFLRGAILKLNEQIAFLEEQKKDLNNLIVYYRSDSFRELEARKRLNLKKPGEKVFIISATPSEPTNLPGNFPEELEKEKEAIAGEPSTSKISNWLLWWQYFTK